MADGAIRYYWRYFRRKGDLQDDVVKTSKTILGEVEH